MDEYYFQNVDGERYLSVHCTRSRRRQEDGVLRLDSLLFTDSLSEATLFRLGKLRLPAWKRRVNIGSAVLLRSVGCCFFECWIRSREVIAKLLKLISGIVLVLT